MKRYEKPTTSVFQLKSAPLMADSMEGAPIGGTTPEFDAPCYEDLEE